MVVDLAEMVREVRREVLEKHSCLDPVSADLNRKRLLELRRVERGERAGDLVGRQLNVFHDLGARDSGLVELCVAVPDVAGGAKLCADKKTEVADEVQGQVARGIRQSLGELPYVGFVGVRKQLVAQRDELAVDEAGNVRSRHELP